MFWTCLCKLHLCQQSSERASAFKGLEHCCRDSELALPSRRGFKRSTEPRYARPPTVQHSRAHLVRMLAFSLRTDSDAERQGGVWGQTEKVAKAKLSLHIL